MADRERDLVSVAGGKTSLLPKPAEILGWRLWTAVRIPTRVVATNRGCGRGRSPTLSRFECCIRSTGLTPMLHCRGTHMPDSNQRFVSQCSYHKNWRTES